MSVDECVTKLKDVRDNTKEGGFRDSLAKDLDGGSFKSHTVSKTKKQGDVQRAIEKFIDAILENLSTRYRTALH